MAVRLPVFTRRARRRLTLHPKFYFFDVGVFRAVRPRGPLDLPEEIDGSALETLVFQELRAINAALGLGYDLYYWRTSNGQEVDFVLYGESGLIALEVKRSSRPRKQDARGLKAFLSDYPAARAYILYRGREKLFVDSITCLPVDEALRSLPALLSRELPGDQKSSQRER